jgi:proteic killer suppression protein
VLADLRSTPSNRFEALEGDRNGQYRIRINKQYRFCFRLVQKSETAPGTDPLSILGEPDDVEITDYP